MKERIIIYGVGEFAELIYFYLSKEYEVVAFTCDKKFTEKKMLNDLPIIDFNKIKKALPPASHKMIIAIGYNGMNKAREEKAKEAKNMGYSFVNYIHPTANVSSNLKIKTNNVILENVIVQPFVEIGSNCIIWSGSHIGHHSVLKDNIFIAPEVAVSGKVKINKNCFIGINSTLRDNIILGESTLIGAGSVVLKSTEKNSVQVGVKEFKVLPRKSHEKSKRI